MSSNRSKRSGPRAGAPIRKIRCPLCGWRLLPKDAEAHDRLMHPAQLGPAYDRPPEQEQS